MSKNSGGKMSPKSMRRSSIFLSLVFTMVFITTGLGSSNTSVNAENNQGKLSNPPFFGAHYKTISFSESSGEGGPSPSVMESVNPDLAMQGIRVPQEDDIKSAIAGAIAPVSTFIVDYYPVGATFNYPEVTCKDVPESVKTPLLAATAVWSTIVQSTVPINISVCWGDANSDTLLSYVYSEKSARRDFTGAPLADTWYPPVLAEALYGGELESPGPADIELLINSGVPWYLGTDANPPLDSYDLVTLVIHSIGHQLGILSGVSGSQGNFSHSLSGSSFVYDSFLEDVNGKRLIDYANGSVGLANIVTSENLWFNGLKANTANAGSRVKVFAPIEWDSQLSLEHLDPTIFAETSNNLMTPSLALGSAQHNVGPVMKGILQDLGWKIGPIVIPVPIKPTGRVNDYTPTFKWKKVNNATQYRFRVFKGTSTTPVYTKTVSSAACVDQYCTNTPGTALKLDVYTWQVRAKIGDSWKPWSSLLAFTEAGPLKGFNSTFDDNADGWSPLRGTWTVSNGSYKTQGVKGEVSSSQRLDVYGIYTYSAKMMNYGCDTCGYGIYFNGNFGQVCLSGNWSDAYVLMVDNNGKFQIAMMENCVFNSLTGWVSYNGITNSWNTVQVTYNKSTGFVQFFINGTRVARGKFTKFRSGVVGVMGYRNTREYSTLSVTTAELIMSAPASAILTDESVFLLDNLTDESSVESAFYEEGFSE